MSPFIKSEKVTGKEKEKDKDDEEEEWKEPHLKTMPDKDQSSLQEQRNGKSKPLQPNKVPESFPCQIGESMPIKKSTKQKGNARDEAEEQLSGGRRVPLSYTDAVQKEKFSPFIRCEKVTEGKKEKGKDDKAEEQKEPHLKAMPENFHSTNRGMERASHDNQIRNQSHSHAKSVNRFRWKRAPNQREAHGNYD